MSVDGFCMGGGGGGGGGKGKDRKRYNKKIERDTNDFWENRFRPVERARGEWRKV